MRFLPGFAVYAVRSERQVRRAAGFLDGALLMDRSWTFWTMTAWARQEDMRAYMTSGAHKAAMPKLMHWCDEASVAHWEQDGVELVSWEEAGPAHAGKWAGVQGAASEWGPSGDCGIGSLGQPGVDRFGGARFGSVLWMTE